MICNLAQDDIFLYEDLMEMYMVQFDETQLLDPDAPEFVLDTLNEIIDKSLHFEPEE